MELTAFFDNFLENVVNLNQSRLDVLNGKISTISNFFNNSYGFKDYYKRLIPQGSYAQKTIIKPPKDKDFDVDLLLSLVAIGGWEPQDYIEKLYDELLSNRDYKNIAEVKTRCVTLNYKGDFHIDIVPFVESQGRFYVANRDDNTWEETNPMGYTKWLMGKNVTAKNQLVKAIRLFKYLRDVKQNFSAKSILLNTLIGNTIGPTEEIPRFKNLSTTFLTVFDRLNDYLQANLSMPKIVNPTLPTEDFNRHWDQDKYSNFRDKVKLYLDRTKDAYLESDKKRSIEKWQAVFGDDFPENVDEDARAASFSVLSSTSKPWGHC